MWPPPKPKPKRAIAVASSNFLNLKEPARTLHISLLARAAIIFRVEEIIVYQESGVPCTKLKDMLEALEAPQYLRKYLVPRSKTYKYLGIAPPLRSPSHPLKGEESVYREGFVVKRSKGLATVDIGLGEPVQVKLPPGVHGRVTLARKGAGWEYIERDEIPIYWGYKVSCHASLRETLEKCKASGYLIIGTSRKGTAMDEVMEEIRRKTESANGLLVVFGTWNKGIPEIAEEEGFDINEYLDFIINSAPHQGAKTIRTEEAVLITLAILNLL